MSIGKLKPVVVVAPAPPPITGQSIYYPYLQKLAQDRGKNAIFVPLRTRSAEHGLRGYFEKYLSALVAALKLISVPRNGKAILVLDSGWGLLSALLHASILRAKGFKILLSHHSFRYVDNDSLFMRTLQQIVGGRAVNIFLCQCMMRKFNSRYGTRDGLVLNNASRVSLEGQPSLVRDEKMFAVGFISNITRDKGILEYLEVIDRLLESGENIYGEIAGPILDNDLQALVASKVDQSRGRIRWRGAIYGADKQAFFSRLSVLVFPTKYDNEAQPNVILEALQAGVPIVSFQRGCIGEDIEGAGSSAVAVGNDFIAPTVQFVRNLREEFDAGRMGVIREKATNRFTALVAEAKLAERALFDEPAAS